MGWDKKVSDDIINSYVKGEIDFNNAKDKLSNVDNIELCGIDEYNVDEVLFMAKNWKKQIMKTGHLMSKDGTIHLVYQRQYYDEGYDYFFINYTIFRNVHYPIKQIEQ